MSVALTVAAALAAALFLCRHLIKRAKSPGPIGFPVLGSLPYMVYRGFTDRAFRWHKFVNEMRKLYGDVMSLRVGTQEFVVISGYAKIKAALVDRGDVFSQRPSTEAHPFYQMMAKGRGLVFSEGQLWQEQRRFALRVLRDFGLGRSLTEEQVQMEARELARQMAECDGQVVDVKNHVTKAVVNVIAGLVFAQRSGYEDPQLDEFLHHAKSLTQAGLDTVLMVFFPQIPVSFGRLLPGSYRLVQSERWIEEYCQAKIDAIAANYDASSEPNCYVEAFLREQRNRADSNDGVGNFDRLQLLRSVMDLYLAGSDTTATTLRWALLYCSFNPEHQDACHREIMTCIGTREANMKDKKDLHRVQAFLDETQRMANLVPMSVEHRAAKDVTYEGVTIATDSLILPNLYSVHMDPELFPEPEVFNPDRFLDKETGYYKPSEYLVPFSVGRRSCLGESLAKMELFLFFTSLMQRFRFEPSEDCSKRRDEILLGLDGIVRSPGDNTLIVHCRKV